MLKNPVLKRILLIVVALAVASVSTFKIKTLMERNRPVEQVLVAKKDIPAQSVITPGDVGFARLPIGSKMSGSIQDAQRVVGRRTSSVIYKGEQILSQKLSDAPLVVGPAERVVAAPVDAVRGVGMTLKQGNNVDVYFIPKEVATAPNGQNIQQIQQAQLVAENAVVVDIVSKSGTSAFNVASENSSRRESNNDNAPSVVVLKVKDSEAQGVATAVESGTIYLVKR